MPLFYLQIENGVEALKIYDFTELFGTRIEVKPFERGNKVNQCWRCQGWFHSSEVCHLPPRCVKCAGPHSAKDCTLDFNDQMKCANCSGAHAANWSRCPKHPNNAKKKAKIKIKKALISLKTFPLKTTPQAPRPDISKARKVSPNLDYSKVVQNQIPREHVSPPSTSTALPTPAPRKDASVNAGLLKDLLVIIEDTPCIDKQIFCRAFKNSFPRSARHLRTWINRIISSKLTASFAPPGLIFPVHVKKSLKIGFWNANSLRNKIHEVREFVNEQNFDLFLVQETWLEPGIDPQIANYRLFKDDRIEFPHTVTRGGTAIYCKNEIVHNRVPLPATPGIDATAVQIKIKNAPPLNIISAYIRKSAQSRFPSEDFKKIFNSGSNCIIAGDFNASHVDWHNVKNTRYGISLRNLVSNLRGAKLVAPQTATHLQPRQRLFVPFPLKGALGSTAITPIEKAEVIADSLQEQFEPNHVADREVFDQRIHEEVANFLATPHVQEIEPTTPTEVLTYVQRIKPKNPRT
ncbi:nucleic-acid-binding protein from transposon X-element [Trichonephila clavipes]|nr:nucleic-acid-binding protein from transposon X-element [Trichonephila clavipes]